MSEPKEDVEVSLEEAAAVLQTTKLNVLMHLKRKLLEGTELDGNWRISRSSLEALKLKTASEGKAVVCRSHCSSAGGCGGCK
ncbi:hypothetical protein DESUT3_08410 [Desulfuromonas versatilis]|uniref:Helix-turn-helix domain-containing protein n=1 Tax=Desulfuromonas versatilis TaxID=2802975 RepID=A0ABN6DVH7_9BACT|nr:DNA-binding protein [Desulfuromonas versatilis]BCR03772.1 hypothetical protein DESUT3_08410 [Desulfuromonas versatilis]